MAANEYIRAAEFIEKAEEAHTLDELQRAFESALRDLGVTSFSMISLVGDGRTRAPRVVMSNTIPGWAEHYWQERFYNADAIADFAFRRETAFSWRDVEERPLPPESRALFAEARSAMSVKGGYCVPVHERDGCTGMVALYQQERELSRRAERALRLMCHTAMEIARALHPTSPAPSPDGPKPALLTVRQRQIMGFVADGRSDWEIAQILNLAASTVNEHMEAAKGRLGVRTRVQAVARAMLHGWIAVEPARF